MIKLYHVWRYYGDSSEFRYLLSTFPDLSLAQSFVRQCEQRFWTYRIEESYLSTYGMADNRRNELIQSVNSILAKGVN